MNISQTHIKQRSVLYKIKLYDMPALAISKQ